ncbi:MAG: D-aminoacyl-tRNA deacylase [Candidatus Thermoplasmatota archaeon]|nr:D-aminoacyl-tRNA deacylase [Candidatus Thermoplasmatota archaeon]
MDNASVCIGKELLSLHEWTEMEKNVYRKGGMLVFFIDDMHLYHDNIDREIKKWVHPLNAVIFASCHKSESGRKTLSVHPIGNFGKAEFGGKNGEMVPSAPSLMQDALQLLHEKAKGTDYDVCYEVTHHGPYLSTPAFFIEAGSTEKEWNDIEACRKIAQVLDSLRFSEGYSTIGVGGGHYAPRFTDLAIKSNVSFGHMIPDYQINNIDREMILKTIDATPGVKFVYFHGKKGWRFKKIFEEEGIERIQ